jgi:hypothetical protein
MALHNLPPTTFYEIPVGKTRCLESWCKHSARWSWLFWVFRVGEGESCRLKAMWGKQLVRYSVFSLIRVGRDESELVTWHPPSSGSPVCSWHTNGIHYTSGRTGVSVIMLSGSGESSSNILMRVLDWQSGLHRYEVFYPINPGSTYPSFLSGKIFPPLASLRIIHPSNAWEPRLSSSPGLLHDPANYWGKRSMSFVWLAI